MKIFTNSALVGMFLLFSSVGMELVGLFTQYYLGFEPCANCVQIRLFILFIGIAGILHLFSNENYIIKICTLLLSIIGTYFSLQFSWDNHLIETGQKLSSCSFGPPFPSLYRWIHGYLYCLRLKALVGQPHHCMKVLLLQIFLSLAYPYC